MTYMVVFLAACIGVGLFAPPKKHLAYVVAGLTLLLIVFYLVKPDHL